MSEMPEGSHPTRQRNPGQAEMVRTVAQQLFETWKAEEARKAKETRRFLGGNLAGWVGLLLLVGGGVVGGSNVYELATAANARSLRNESTITAMKTDNSDRLARIETKIDLIMEERKR